MIVDALTAVQDKLLELYPQHIAYLSEDWGQIDRYAERPPVNFPCVLLDIAQGQFSDLTRRVQRGEATLVVRIADLYPVNVSAAAPCRDRQFRLFCLVRHIYASLQGLSGERFSGLTRLSLERAARKDSIREYVLRFRFSGTDDAAYAPLTPTPDVGLDLTVTR